MTSLTRRLTENERNAHLYVKPCDLDHRVHDCNEDSIWNSVVFINFNRRHWTTATVNFSAKQHKILFRLEWRHLQKTPGFQPRHVSRRRTSIPTHLLPLLIGNEMWSSQLWIFFLYVMSLTWAVSCLFLRNSADQFINRMIKAKVKQKQYGRQSHKESLAKTVSDDVVS